LIFLTLNKAHKLVTYLRLSAFVFCCSSRNVA